MKNVVRTTSPGELSVLSVMPLKVMVVAVEIGLLHVGDLGPQETGTRAVTAGTVADVMTVVMAAAAVGMTDEMVSGIVPAAVLTISPDVPNVLSVMSLKGDQVVAVVDTVVMTVVETVVETGGMSVDPLQRSVTVTGSARAAGVTTLPVGPTATSAVSPNKPQMLSKEHYLKLFSLNIIICYEYERYICLY